MEMPVVRLSTGLRVANFSSPHPFRFTTGEELPACAPERSKGLMLEAVEGVSFHPKGWTDIELAFEMSGAVLTALDIAEARDDVDVVLCPLPVLELARGRYSKVRGIRVADRVTKTIYPDRFCL